MSKRLLLAALVLAAILALAGCSGTRGNVALTTGLPRTGMIAQVRGVEVPLPSDVKITFSITLTPEGGGGPVQFFNDTLSLQAFVAGQTYYLTVLEGTYDSANIHITSIEVGEVITPMDINILVTFASHIVIPPVGTSPIPVSFLWTGTGTTYTFTLE